MTTLRVLLTADPDLPVPPREYGGIERVIALLADGLVARGHDVVLAAHRDSTAGGRLVAYTRDAARRVSAVERARVVRTAARLARPDVIHSFGRLASLAGVWLWRVPKIMSYQRAITPRSVAWGHRLGRGRVTFTACSRRMTDRVSHLAPWRVIPNAVDTARYRFEARVDADAPFVFLGRLEPIKGAHLAIEIARQCARRLVIAGTVTDAHRDYFARAIAPRLDGDRVRYMGPVDDAAKNAILGSAAALLMPVQWDEPFGLVMAEALACGTPVLGLDRGAVPEVVDDGVTGAVRGRVEDVVAAGRAVNLFDRAACRRAAESRFSAPALVSAYEAVYREVAAARALAPRAGRRAEAGR